MRLMRRFQEHPRSVGEAYTEHEMNAARFGVAMWAGSLAWLRARGLPVDLYNHR